MKSQKLTILTLLFFLASIALITIPASEYVFGVASNFSNFNVTLTISTQQACNITAIGTASGTPNEGSTKTIYILFNVTDPENNINYATDQTHANITYGTTTRSSLGSACASYTAWDSAPNRGVNCSITINYYDNPGDWNITAFCVDGGGSNVSSQNNGFAYAQLYGMQINKTEITFSNPTANQNDVGSNNHPLGLNNTGNMEFGSINVTAYDLYGGSALDTIPASALEVSITDVANSGVAMNNDTPVTITSADLNTTRTTGTEQLYFFIDIPLVSSGTYNSTAEWVVEAYN